MNEFLKVKEIKDLKDDYDKCDYYINSLNNGNITCLNDAINFSNKKYREFYIKDTEISLMNTNFIPTNLDNVSQTIQNLIAIKNMINGKISKKIDEE